MANSDTLSVTPETSVTDMIDIIENGPPGPWPRQWAWWNNTREAFRILTERQADSIKPYPEGKYSGRGIVICGGGVKYFPGVYVCVSMLRHHGCRLPIELWYLGDSEMDPTTIGILEPYGVTCIDIKAVERKYPARILCGWESKPYAALHSRFEDVLFLDADNYPLKDPTYMFDTRDYVGFGSVFWPDYDNWILRPDVFEIFGIEHRHETAIESGQYMVNKRKSWRALNLALWYAEHSDYVFNHVYGDKECFHLAWRWLDDRWDKYGDTKYGIPDVAPAWNTHCIIQHDFQGQHLFHHRCQDKLKLSGENRWLDNLAQEDLVKGFLAELREIWDGKLWHNARPNEEEQKVISEVEEAKFLYKRIGYDERLLAFNADGRVGLGSADCERRWEVNLRGGIPVLTLCGEHTPTVHLYKGDDGVWRGNWMIGEKMAVELVPIIMSAVKSTKNPGCIKLSKAMAEQDPELYQELKRTLKTVGHEVILEDK